MKKSIGEASMKSNPGKMFKNVEVKDATEGVEMSVRVQRIIEGVPKDYENCAGSLTAKLDYHYHKARFYRDTIYLQKTCDSPVLRYKGNKSTEMIEFLNDAKAIPTAAKEYTVRLDPPRKSQTLESTRKARARLAAKKKKGLPTKKYNRKHRKPCPKDVFGVRAPAPRNAEW